MSLHWSRIVRWRRLQPLERKLLNDAFIQLYQARWITRFRAFPRIAAGLDIPSAATCDMRVAGQCATAIRRAARFVPFRALCFEQALGLHAMLYRRGIPARLHYGVVSDHDGKLESHVWVTCKGEVILGGETRAGFQELVTFPACAASA